MKIRRLMLTWPLSKVLSVPFSANVKITERCNLRCAMCGIWRKADRFAELEVGDWKRIAGILRKWRLGRVVLTGGEPFMRRDLERIVGVFAAEGFSLTLLTNGVLADKRRMKSVIDSGVNDLGISLDSLDPRIQSRICGRGDITSAILGAIETAVQYTPGIVEVMITVSGLNISEVPEIVRRVHEMGAYAVVNPVNAAVDSSHATILTGAAQSLLPVKCEPAVVDYVYDTLKRLKEQGLRVLNSNRFLEDSRRYLKGGGFAWSCDAGIDYFTVFSDGSTAGCSDLPAFRNLARDSGRRNTADMRKMLERQRSGCPGCIYSCWREVSYLLHDPGAIMERMMTALRFAIHPQGKAGR